MRGYGTIRTDRASVHLPVFVSSLELGFIVELYRQQDGIYQHVSEHHLQRYVTEFDFRSSNRVALGVNDSERATKLLRGVKGKRLTYQTVTH